MRQKRKNTSSNLEKQKNVLISMNTYICQKIRLRSILIKKENVI
jgi:hypothetical protein